MRDMLVDLANKLLVSNYVRFDTVQEPFREQVRITATMMVCEPFTIKQL